MDPRHGSKRPLAEPVQLDQPLQRLSPGGNRRPVAAVLIVAAMLVAAVWQPWGRTRAPGPIAHVPAPTVALPTPAPSTAAPTPAPSQPGPPESATYVSLVDHEWTVVALLASSPAGSTEEPATQHPSPSGATGALLVLQQGVVQSSQPMERAGQPDLACHTPAVPRDERAVYLPAGRVVYLGVTFPGINPTAKVAAIDLDAPGARLRHVASVVVPLEGRTAGLGYRLPSSGPGAVLFFALPSATILPSATYRIDVTLPGTAVHRFVYACVGP